MAEEKKKGSGKVMGLLLLAGGAWVLWYYNKNGYFPWSKPTAPVTAPAQTPTPAPAVSTNANINDVVVPVPTYEGGRLIQVNQARAGNEQSTDPLGGSSIPSDNPQLLKVPKTPAPIDASKYLAPKQVVNTVDNVNTDPYQFGAPLLSGLDGILINE